MSRWTPLDSLIDKERRNTICGIVYAESFLGTPVNNAVMQQFDQQRTRGTEGFGLFNGKHLVHAAKEDRILNWLVKEKNESELIMFHHRRPTSTINVRKAAHPFSTKKYFGKNQYILVHNGYIGNDDELKAEHEKLGIKYQTILDDGTFNDSEALLWDVALYLEGKQPELKAYGGIAFTCMKLVGGKLDKLYFARNSNPLNMARDKSGIMLSSEGEGEPIAQNTLHTWNYALKRLTKRKLEINSWKPYDKSEWENDKTWNYKGSGYSYDGTYSRAGIPKALPWGDDWDDNDYTSYTAYNGFIDCELCDDEGMLKGCYDCGKDKDLPNTSLREAYISRVDPITDAEVQTEAMAYLASVKGKFFDAIWNIDKDYDETIGNPTTKVNIRKQLLLERVADHLENDEEYINEHSVSSIWRAIWQQQQLT